MSNEHKVALVTGATRGIGQAIALKLASEGMTMVGTATSQKGADSISATFETNKLPGRGLVLDVTEQASIDALLENMASAEGKPDVLVNNAGITQDNLLMRMKDEEWQRVMDTNLTSVYRLVKPCLRSMMRNRWGRIINISSVVGLTGNPGQCNYAASKAGMIAFSKSLAGEIASRGITVNVIAPGFIETDMTTNLTEEQRAAILSRVPMQTLGQAEDIAHAVSFLASLASGYITGETLNVNGGMFMQ